MSDEIYEYINFAGKHESIAQYDELKERVIIINGLSKGYAMTGWRVGYIAASTEIVKACEKLQGQFTSATNSIAQRAAIAALTGDMTPTHEMLKAFTIRREFVMNTIKEIPGMNCTMPDGAFYIFPDMTFYFGKKTPDGDVIKDSDDLCMYLLNKAHVSTVTGRAFGQPKCIRISFANNLENLKKGFDKLKNALSALS